MKLSNISAFVIIVAIVLAGIAWAAYSLGRSSQENDLFVMKNEVEELKAKEKEAAIVKRVSQQMEAIAYEQMNMSNKQRDRAEEQSRLAEANAARAEEQSRLAQQNAAEARQQSRLAQQNAESARQAAEDARRQRDVATLSKSISDTLSFRTLSRSLGTTSIAKFESRENELGCILAYTSWYFSDKYHGNVYQEETFKALTEATGGIRTYSEPRLGVIHDVAVLPDNANGCVVVTNYGEVELIENDKPRMIMEDSNYDFRSVWLSTDRILALSFSGRLCVLSYKGKIAEVSLPDDRYMKILPVNKSTVLITAQRCVSWFDTRNMRVTQTQQLDRDLSAAVMREGKLLLFFKDGSCDEMNASGEVTGHHKFVKGVVTAVLYDNNLRILFLGLKSGDIALIGSNNNFTTMLNGHLAQITDMSISGTILVSSSYDKNVFVWNLPKLKTDIMNSEIADLTDSNGQTTPSEWLVPAAFTCSGWGLALSTQKDVVWIGQSDGKVLKECISADKMARKAYARMKRGLTRDEWMQYVGPYAEYENLK